MYKIIAAGFRHETNTFSKQLADLEFFKSREYLLGDEIVPYFTGTRTEFGGFIHVLGDRSDVEMIPVISADAMPSGPVTAELAAEVERIVIEAIRAESKVDGILLALHGGMVTTESEDGEGDFLEAIRNEVGDDVPIFVVLDLHSNYTEKMNKYADVCINYDYYPHTDMFERGAEAARAMLATLEGEIKPAMRYKRLPLLVASMATSDPAMKKFVNMAHEYEKDSRVISVSISHGFFCADIQELGVAVVVVTDNDPECAQCIADELADAIWQDRAALVRQLSTPDEAIQEALSMSAGPVVFSEGTDNPGGGSMCDGTHLLRALIEQKVTNAAFAIIYDPESVDMAIKAGVGNEVKLRLGGKQRPEILGEPIECTAYVKTISDGKYRNKGPMGRGLQVNLRKSAVVVIDGIEVIVSSNITQPYDAEIFRSHGIEPKDRHIIVVKSTVHFRADFEPLASKIIDVDTPGMLPQDLFSIDFKNLKRPIYPLDDM